MKGIRQSRPPVLSKDRQVSTKGLCMIPLGQDHILYVNNLFDYSNSI